MEVALHFRPSSSCKQALAWLLQPMEAAPPLPRPLPSSCKQALLGGCCSHGGCPSTPQTLTVLQASAAGRAAAANGGPLVLGKLDAAGRAVAANGGCPSTPPDPFLILQATEVACPPLGLPSLLSPVALLGGLLQPMEVALPSPLPSLFLSSCPPGRGCCSQWRLPPAPPRCPPFFLQLPLLGGLLQPMEVAPALPAALPHLSVLGDGGLRTKPPDSGSLCALITACGLLPHVTRVQLGLSDLAPPGPAWCFVWGQPRA
ncbi:hypothetical protein CYMTET_25480 [Cymbomonas tetramitiformis]|uniref:Uncharacterized protein n=1 Tax=Cymbomonas tetramitiformis TaxID=36881 RepID=A0AAE0FUD8_9CHLO|nr:hypothetical protein CYMTET_25480 [Cymbomonas tetramitiformis]